MRHIWTIRLCFRNSRYSKHVYWVFKCWFTYNLLKQKIIYWIFFFLLMIYGNDNHIYKKIKIIFTLLNIFLFYIIKKKKTLAIILLRLRVTARVTRFYKIFILNFFFLVLSCWHLCNSWIIWTKSCFLIKITIYEQSTNLLWTIINSYIYLVLYICLSFIRVYNYFIAFQFLL